MRRTTSLLPLLVFTWLALPVAALELRDDERYLRELTAVQARPIAFALNADYAAWRADLAWASYRARAYANCVDICTELVVLDPATSYYLELLVAALTRDAAHRRAANLARIGMARFPERRDRFAFAAAIAHRAIDEHELARELLATVAAPEAAGPQAAAWHEAQATLHAVAGETEEMLQHL
ncbi:MAG: hypothetical protein ACOCYV_01595, partial [Planctomycetota bacterium]